MKAQWQQLQRACTILYRFPSDNPRKPTPTELSWIDLLYNSTPSFKKRAKSDASVPDAPTRAEKFAQRLECRHFLKPSVLKRVKSALLTKAKQRIASTYGNKSD